MPRPMGPGRGRRNIEKPKDFQTSVKKLIKSLSSWKKIVILAIILGFISSILALIAPNKLKDFANEIQKGIIPNTEVLTEISNNIQTSMNNNMNYQNISSILEDQDVSLEIKQELSSFLVLVSNGSKEEIYNNLGTLSPQVLSLFLNEFEVNGVNITIEDQFKMLALTKEFDKSNISNNIKLFDKLPENIYKLVKPKIDIDKIKSIVIFMAIIYVISAMFSYIQSYSMVKVANEYARRLRNNISNKINKLPLKYFDSHENGDILSRVTNDVDSIAFSLNNSLATLISSITLFIGSIVMMFVTNYIMAITAILSTFIGFILMFIILGKSQKYFVENQNVLGELNGYIEEMYSGHNVVKVYNGTKQAISEFDEINNRLYKAKRNSIFLSGMMQPIMGFIGNFGYVAVCIVGALLVIDNKTSFGTIVAFMIYIRMFTNPLSQIAQAMQNLQTATAAGERVFEFLEEDEMSKQNACKEKIDISEARGNIVFKNVKFGYDDDKIIIKNFSANIKKGQKIAIVGPTGAGKTTLVNLLMKFYEINDGEILIDGIKTEDLTRENIHDLFCMVLQDTWLFNGTVRDNIKFNNKNITDKMIWDSLKVVGIDHFVKTLPGGLDAIIDNSDNVSSGEKQLFTIARGMIKNAPFLILDEATSNVDTRTEELVAKAMDKLTEGKTSFIIAHRLSTIKNADLILVLNEGNIIEQGTHKELLEQNGFYANLYNSQFENIIE